MSNKHAVVIDDDRSNLAIWELVLNENGYEVQTADSMESARDYLSDDVGIFLVDYHLPDGNGSELVAYVRENFPNSFVVMVSMDDDADVIRESIRAGGNVFMVKPTSPQAMGQLISEIESGTLDISARQLITRHGRRNYSQ